MSEIQRNRLRTRTLLAHQADRHARHARAELLGIETELGQVQAQRARVRALLVDYRTRLARSAAARHTIPDILGLREVAAQLLRLEDRLGITEANLLASGIQARQRLQGRENEALKMRQLLAGEQQAHDRRARQLQQRELDSAGMHRFLQRTRSQRQAEMAAVPTQNARAEPVKRQSAVYLDPSSAGQGNPIMDSRGSGAADRCTHAAHDSPQRDTPAAGSGVGFPRPADSGRT